MFKEKPPHNSHLPEEAADTADTQTQKHHSEFLRDHFVDIEGGFENTGFLYVPAENITFQPPTKESDFSTLIIQEPQDKKGINDFAARNAYEKDHPSLIKAYAEYINTLFRGTNTIKESFHPPFGTRICFYNVTLYETTDEQLISIPIIPDNNYKYAQHVKLPASNVVRGTRFPRVREALQFAGKSETSTFVQRQSQHPEERLMTRGTTAKTGLWNVQMINHKNQRSGIQNCHINHDPETNTFDIFAAQKRIVLDGNDFDTIISNLPDDRPVHALVSLKDLAQAYENDTPLPIHKIYNDSKRVSDITDLPKDYQDMFTTDKNGDLALTDVKPVPPLRAFLELEGRMIHPSDQQTENEIREKVGDLFEEFVAEVFDMEKKENVLSQKVPPNIMELVQDRPESFRQWVQEKISHRKEYEINPDFILSDGTLVEVKGDAHATNRGRQKDQRSRMILYSLLEGKNRPIRMISLYNEPPQSPISNVTYENIFNTPEYKDFKNQNEKSLKLLQIQNLLKKLQPAQ